MFSIFVTGSRWFKSHHSRREPLEDCVTFCSFHNVWDSSTGYLRLEIFVYVSLLSEKESHKLEGRQKAVSTPPDFDGLSTFYKFR
jgi:hypothetical protein